MKTTYYFVETNGGNEVIAVRGGKCYSAPTSSSGLDITSGIDLYTQKDGFDDIDTIVSALKAAYGELIADGTLYNMDDIERDFPDAIVDFNADDYETLIAIAEVD